MKVVIDNEKYGVCSEFSSIDEAEKCILDCGYRVGLFISNNGIIDQDGEVVGYFINS